MFGPGGGLQNVLLAGRRSESRSVRAQGMLRFAAQGLQESFNFNSIKDLKSVLSLKPNALLQEALGQLMNQEA